MSSPPTLSRADAPPRDTFAVARAWLGEHEHIALATVISTWGSSPVPVGGQMVIAGEDAFQGSVSGGCVEGEVIVAALDVIADGRPRVMTFGVSNETAWQAGLPCGGNVGVLVVRLDRAASLPVLDAVLDAQMRRQEIVLASDLGSGAIRVLPSATATGPIGDAIQRGSSAVVSTETISTEAGGSQFVHVISPPPRIVVVGATHIAQHLVTMLRLVGYDTIVVDPRSAYATPARFGAVTVVTEWPDDALPALGLDAYTGVVAVAHVPDIDDQALKLALAAGCFYVGALGSKRNHARRSERLAGAGIGEVAIARIRAPVGLDIGANGPAEIAASILAEIIQARRRPAVR